VMDTYAAATKAVESFLQRTQGIESFDPKDLDELDILFE
jgi:hypothetical protein